MQRFRLCLQHGIEIYARKMHFQWYVQCFLSSTHLKIVNFMISVVVLLLVDTHPSHFHFNSIKNQIIKIDKEKQNIASVPGIW